MSNFYLCDYCEMKLDGDHLNTCECLPFNGEHRKRPIHDSQTPEEVCKEYEPKEGDHAHNANR